LARHDDVKGAEAQRGPSALRTWLLPVGRSGWAIAAGYFGLLTLTPFAGWFFGVFAILCAVVAFRNVGRDPSLGGQGRATFGLLMGCLALTFWPAMLTVLLLSAAVAGR
jgi:hypothetical protein